MIYLLARHSIDCVVRISVRNRRTARHESAVLLQNGIRTSPSLALAFACTLLHLCVNVCVCVCSFALTARTARSQRNQFIHQHPTLARNRSACSALVCAILSLQSRSDAHKTHKTPTTLMSGLSLGLLLPSLLLAVFLRAPLAAHANYAGPAIVEVTLLSFRANGTYCIDRGSDSQAWDNG